MARRVEHCGAIGSQNGAHMSEIKYFLERKRDGPRGLVAGRRGRASVTCCLINFIFLTSNNIKVDEPRQPNFFRRGKAAPGRALCVRAKGRQIPFSKNKRFFKKNIQTQMNFILDVTWAYYNKGP